MASQHALGVALALIFLFSTSNQASFPPWLNGHGRQVLQAPIKTLKADIVVAQDGSGHYHSLEQALAQIPARKPESAYLIIHVKRGVYQDQITVGEELRNLMVVGDGPSRTRFTGGMSSSTPGISHTSDTATFRFICRRVGFENTAGPYGEQAVALRVAADKAVFFRCRFDGFQDTLLAESQRQYYLQCTVTGTVDFIFGRAAAIFQRCDILIRKPIIGQQCVITAHGREEQDAATGFVLHQCSIKATPEYNEVQSQVQSYLGRPWKAYARTLVLESFIDSVIDPQGWIIWPKKDYHLTCWFGEFQNTGPGAATNQRVNWPGYKKDVTPEEAEQFTADKFLNGSQWIKGAGFSGLIV